MTNKPYSPACDRNREPILEVLRTHLIGQRRVLEIGSGTGQHAVYFARHLPHLTWQCSDRAEMLPGIRMWLEEAALDNTPPPLALDANGPWPRAAFDAIFSANTLHIMAWHEVEQMFEKLPRVIAQCDVRLVLYGPFKYGGRHTSNSNAAFEASLVASAPHRAIRDIEAVDDLASAIGFELIEDRAMPANNRCLVWLRPAASGTGE